MGNVIEFIKYHLRMTKFSLPSSIRIIDIVQILLSVRDKLATSFSMETITTLRDAKRLSRIHC